MKKVGMLALLMALALLMTGCAQDESAWLDKGVVRLGNVCYTYGDLLVQEADARTYYDELGLVYMTYGIEPPVVTDAQIREEVVNDFVVRAVVLDKADKMGLDELTQDETAQINARTDAAMAQYRTAMASELALPEDMDASARDAAIDAALTERGITRARVQRSQREAFVIEKTRAWAVAGVQVTEAEFEAAYHAAVETDRNQISADPGLYGLRVLNGESPMYAPAGYREVEWIYVEYAPEDQALIGALRSAQYNAGEQVKASEDAARAVLGTDADLDALVGCVQVTLDESDPTAITVTETVASFESDPSPEEINAVMKLAGDRAVKQAYDRQLEAAIAAANAAITPEVDEILGRLRNGEEWWRVREHYNDDTQMYHGSPVVCADFPYVPAEYAEAAMALTTPGQWTQGVYEDGYGCFIILYVADVPEGAVDAESVRAEMTARLLAEKQAESFSSTVDIWYEQASDRLFINYELLGW